MSSPRSWFRLPLFYRTRAERRESPALVALHWDGTTPKENQVANISDTGAFLRTGECWRPGELLSLTLQRRGALEKSKSRRFTVQARAVRRDHDGVGVSFMLPPGTDLRLWESAVNAEIPRHEPEDVVREFRVAAAIAFLQRISPGAAERVRSLFRQGLSSHRLEGAIEIALHAAELLSLAPRNHLQTHADVVLRILEDGSWTEVDWIRHYWSGLLVSSCSEKPVEAPDLHFPGLLSQLTTIQTRILASACDTARKLVDAEGKLVALRLTRSGEELARISGTHDRAHIERDVHQLTLLGLLEQRVKWNFFSLLEQADITPTASALELYARCHAYRGDAAGFYRIEERVGSGCAVN